jgi:hypothetical protein
MADDGAPAAGSPPPPRGHRGPLRATLVGTALAEASVLGATLIGAALVGTGCVGGMVIRTARGMVESLIRLGVGTAQRNAWDATCADLQRRVEGEGP